MSRLRRSSLHFARTPVFGWNGSTSAWDRLYPPAALQPYGRTVTGTDSGEKLRVMLSDPDLLYPSAYTSFRFGDAASVTYLRGRTMRDVSVSAYLDVTVLMMAELTGVLTGFEDVLDASGLPAAFSRVTLGTFPCARESVGEAADNTDPAVKYADANLYLPSDALVNTDMEVQIGLDFYEIESVFNTHGLLGLRCVTRRSAVPHG